MFFNQKHALFSLQPNNICEKSTKIVSKMLLNLFQ